METLNGTDLEPSISTSDDDETDAVETTDTPKARSNASGPKTDAPESAESSYEDGWYQVLKRRADGSGDED